MSPTDDRPLDDRKASILRAVVEEYIETAQPVGSSHIVDAPGVRVSSATVRNDMAALEAEGFLTQPHTSAGRIPTEKGYRFFVDHLGAPGRLRSTDAQQVRSFFAQAHGELERMLADTTRLLADLTRYTAVVVGPPHEAATIRSVQLVGLGPRLALVVVVLSNGAVDKHTLEFVEDVEEVTLSAASTILARQLVGRVFDALDGIDLGSGPGVDVAVAALGALSGTAGEGERVYIGGAARVASAFDAVAQVSEVLRILEEQFVVVGLLQDVLDRGLNVAIGTETGMQPLSECAVVVAPYEIDGEPAGTIGVLGPTRMNYPQAIAAVAVVSKRLGRTLSEG